MMDDPLAQSLEFDRQKQLQEEASQDPMAPALDLERPLLGESTLVTSLEAMNQRKPRANRGRLMVDMAFAGLFAVFGVTTLVLAFTSGLRSIFNKSLPRVYDESGALEPGSYQPRGQMGQVVLGLLVVCFISSAMMVLWMNVMVLFAPLLINYTIIGMAVLGVLTTILFFVMRNIAAGVIALLVTLGAMYYYRLVQKRVYFASVNIKVACAAIRENPAVLLMGFGLVICQVAWCILWILAAVGVSTNGTTKTLVSDAGQAFGLSQCTTYTTMGPDVTFSPSCVSAGTCNKCVCGPDGVVVWENAACFTYRFYVGSYVVMLLGFLWACAVIKNIVHCTISGTVAMWWFAGHSSSDTVRDSLKRACTTSLGSICLGSLLVAIVGLARRWVYSLYKLNRASESSTLLAVLDCLLSTADRALAYFNKMAFVYVAMYGMDFMSAGVAATELFRARGVTNIINDQLLDNVFQLSCIVMALLSSLFAYAYSKHASTSYAVHAILSVSGALVGYVVALIVTAVIESAVSTIQVCFAEDPQVLAESHPDLSTELVQAWEMMQRPIGIMPTRVEGSYDNDMVRATVKGPLINDKDMTDPPEQTSGRTSPSKADDTLQ